MQQTAVLEAAQVYDQVSLGGAGSAQAAAGQQPLQLPASRVETITGQLRDSVQRDAELWAGIIRSWLAEEENA